jgi:uncharacterized repeat protein (TIGR01451 family)
MPEGSPTTNYGSTTDLLVDASGHVHTVIKFPNVFGGGVDQIPLGSTITSATLTVQMYDPGDDVLVYQLTEGWVESEVTWNNRSTGVSWTNAGADGTGSHKTTADGTLLAPNGSNNVDVTTSVQNWSDGELNEGWLLKDTGSGGVDIRSSEYGTVSERPMLSVTYVPPAANNPPTVAAAIPDTTVIEDSAPVDNYRDLNAVFTDVEDASQLTFTIQSNTNPGLVTPTIGADSALDMSFTASTTGTATITVRATDSGALFVDDVFIVTVTAAPAAATLVGRYWLNEAPSGQGPTTVLDDQPSPLNLSVTYDANLAWTLNNGHRGLSSSVVHAGIASATAAGTKYTTNLDRATQATFVVVMEWGAGNADRMAGFQRSDGTRTFQLMSKSGGDLELRYDGLVENPRMYWPGTWDDGVRRVFHIVYDSDDPTQDDRVRLYVNGVDQGTPTLISGLMPPLSDSLDFSDPTIELAVTNESDLSNGLPGTVYYYAVYTGEMTDPQITADATALLADDDNLSFAVAVTPDGVDTVSVLPSNGTAYSYRYTITNNSAVTEDFDLFGFAGGAGTLTLDSILGPNVTQGATPDSAQITGVPASSADSAFVWYSVANVAAGTVDSLYLEARSASNGTVSDSGWVFVEVVKPNLTTGKAVNPSGTQLPGTELTYTVTITNDGNDDAASVVVMDSLAVELDFKVGTVVNNLPAGVSATVEYSNDAGSSWTYVPVSAGCGAPATFDACVTHIRWTLQQDLSYVGPDNTGNVEFVARIQ